MGKVQPEDQQNTIVQLKKPNPIKGNKTWLRHLADKESGLIDIMILKGTYSINEMIRELSSTPHLTPKTINDWRARVNNHILHLSTKKGDSRNRAAGIESHNLRVKENKAGKIIFDY